MTTSSPSLDVKLQLRDLLENARRLQVYLDSLVAQAEQIQDIVELQSSARSWTELWTPWGIVLASQGGSPGASESDKSPKADHQGAMRRNSSR